MRAAPDRVSARSSPMVCVLELEGDANDYVGKGMEGGKIVVRAPGNPGEPADRQCVLLRRARR